MMQKTLILTLTLAMLLAACGREGAESIDPGAVAAPSSSDRLLQRAAALSMLDLQAAELAETKGTHPQVRSLARDLRNQHERLLTRLQEVTDTTGLSLPDALGPEQSDRYYELRSGIPGVDFDEDYVELTARNHDMAIEVFKDLAKTPEPKLRDLARHGLETLHDNREHIDRVDVAPIAP